MQDECLTEAYCYGWQGSNGVIYQSREYTDWERCFEDYVVAMHDLVDIGINLANLPWRVGLPSV